MTDETYIRNTPLPDYLNFDRLKEEGLDTIRELASPNWSNLNETDPGVTILDQLCYALTELGYCTEFPIEDILTQRDGTISFEDQFFLPDRILTTLPVTAVDYAKLVLDAFSQLQNVQIYPVNTPTQQTTGLYQVDLLVEGGLNDQEQTDLSQAVFYFLHQHRNLGEFFLRPRLLDVVEITLTGTIVLENHEMVNDVLDQMESRITDYLWPRIVRQSYSDLEQAGDPINAIFNGPRLRNGWIPTEQLAPDTKGIAITEAQQPVSRKNNKVQLVEIFRVLLEISAIKSFHDLKLWQLSQDGFVSVEMLDLKLNQAARFTVTVNGLEESLVFLKNNVRFDLDSPRLEQPVPQSLYSDESIGVALDLCPPLPKGTFRDIEEYYSIQNTFPKAYALGEHSLEANAPRFRRAQARQLQGYLMVFDQLLANQFSQLAHVAQLFSFKQSISEPPAPNQSFSTTYFYQPLYHIPHIRPVLAGNEQYDYSFRSGLSVQEQREAAWQKYQNDPFNQYNYGLSQCIESEAEADERRNRMLDHLLARHGESAEAYEEAILTPRWAGSLKKTQILTKSLILQNYELLSYNRQKSYNFLGASALSPLEDLSSLPRIDLYTDFQLNVEKLEKLQTLKPEDFTNFSTFELKLNILLGLKQHYYLLILVLEGLITAKTGKKSTKGALQTWLQRGTEAAFELEDYDLKIEVEETANAQGVPQKVHCIFMGDQLLLKIDVTWKKATDGIQIYQEHIAQLRWLADERKGFILLETILLLHAAGMALQDQDVPPTFEIEAPAWKWNQKVFFLQGLLLFPNYVTLVSPERFQTRLERFIEEHWPVHVAYTYQALSFAQLKAIIPEYIAWYNQMRFQFSDDTSALRGTSAWSHAKKLMELLPHIFKPNSGAENG